MQSATMANMPEIPADPNILPKRYSRFWFRFFEILPGATAWIAILTPFVLSVYTPLWVTLFIIVFDVHWLIRSLNYGVLLLQGYYRMKRNRNTDWLKRLEETRAASHTPEYAHKILDWQEVVHTVILTTYKEDIAILRASIQSIIEADFDNSRIIFMLATEERAGEMARQQAAKLYEEFKDTFRVFLVSEHPDGIAGEVKAKGANATWAAKNLIKYVDQQRIPLDRVIVSTADADTRFDKAYFGCLTYSYVTTEDRVHACYQPVAMYSNNIWKAPMLSRVLAFSTTFWQLMESIRSYRLITFATHATSLKTLKDINFWCTEIVNEDSRQFFRGFFHYDGHFRVIPLFIPIYMDAVHVENYLSTIKNLYLQQQRWAYGVEHFPYIVLESLRHPKIPWIERWSIIWRAFDGSFSWATASFFITVVGWLPIYLNEKFRDQVAASNFPIVTQYLLTITWIGLFISGYITVKLLPPPPRKRKRQFIPMILQWMLSPVAAIFFGVLPGIDAQTRLMLGKYIGFRVTEKAPVKTEPVPNA